MRAAAVVAASAGLFTAVSTGPASAGVWQATFELGNQPGEGGTDVGYTHGGINFTNQSVQIQGTVKSNNIHCAQVTFFVFYANQVDAIDRQTRTACGRGPGSSRDFNFTVPAPKPGGAERVNIFFDYQDSKDHWVYYSSTSVSNLGN
ncbi:hypothetical protein ACWDZ6_05530 [Streptomyces sp. NPDC002926]